MPRPIAVAITGGDTVNRDAAGWRVPKRDLVAALQVAMQRGHLKIARNLRHADTLVHELANFRMTIDPRTAHDSYASWRERDHDDLLLASALAVWWAERNKQQQPSQQYYPDWSAGTGRLFEVGTGPKYDPSGWRAHVRPSYDADGRLIPPPDWAVKWRDAHRAGRLRRG